MSTEICVQGKVEISLRGNRGRSSFRVLLRAEINLAKLALASTGRKFLPALEEPSLSVVDARVKW